MWPTPDPGTSPRWPPPPAPRAARSGPARSKRRSNRALAIRLRAQPGTGRPAVRGTAAREDHHAVAIAVQSPGGKAAPRRERGAIGAAGSPRRRRRTRDHPADLFFRRFGSTRRRRCPGGGDPAARGRVRELAGRPFGVNFIIAGAYSVEDREFIRAEVAAAAEHAAAVVVVVFWGDPAPYVEAGTGPGRLWWSRWDRSETARTKPVRSRRGAPVSDVPGDKKNENLHPGLANSMRMPPPTAGRGGCAG